MEYLVKSIPSDHINICYFVEFCSHPTRGSSIKHTLCKTDLDRNFYFNHILRLWNPLPTLDIDLPLCTIKFNLWQFIWDHFMPIFESNNTCSFHYLCPCPKCSKSCKHTFQSFFGVKLPLPVFVRLLAQCQSSFNTVSIILTFSVYLLPFWSSISVVKHSKR